MSSEIGIWAKGGSRGSGKVSTGWQQIWQMTGERSRARTGAVLIRGMYVEIVAKGKHISG